MILFSQLTPEIGLCYAKKSSKVESTGISKPVSEYFKIFFLSLVDFKYGAKFMFE